MVSSDFQVAKSKDYFSILIGLSLITSDTLFTWTITVFGFSPSSLDVSSVSSLLVPPHFPFLVGEPLNLLHDLLLYPLVISSCFLTLNISQLIPNLYLLPRCLP